MNRYCYWKLALLLSLSACLWCGCGKSGDNVLAVVGDYKITAQEFDEMFRVRYPFASAQDEFDAKRQALDSAVVARLLIQAAYEKGIDNLEEVSRVVLANKDKFLLDVLMHKKIAEKARPSEAELKEFYNRLEYKIRASHILISSPDTAQALLDRIRSGENFEKLAYDYSIDRSAKRNKGDLGYFTWGAMVDEFQRAAFSMEPGEVSPPVKSKFGYHIIKLVDKLPNEQRADYQTMKSSLVDMVTQYNSRRLGEQYFDQIRQRYIVAVDTATCNYLLHKRENLYPPQLLATLPRNDFDQEQLDRNERELVLATWDGGQITVIEYLTQSSRALPLNVRPDFDDYDSLAVVIFRLKLNDILVVEAHREGTDNDADFLRKLKLFKELAMAEMMKDDSLPQPPPPDEETVRQYYDQHPEEFTVPARVHVHEILLSDELKARKLKEELRSLEAFKKAASQFTERSGKRIGGGDLNYIERQWMPELFDAAWNTPLGGIGGPVPVEGKYALFYVADKIDAQLKDYLGMKRQIVQILVDQGKQAMLSKWVEERRQQAGVTISEDALWSTIDKTKYAAADTTGTAGTTP
ncbi:MAG TPA: peptidylprolyl isomerase [Candidatus Deferrimicrobium sp.]|nr:peptidylprolyl isomerase [Candidatus Deferrimicrobium sp.]